MTNVFDFAQELMGIVSSNWSYYDRDWGRTRCRFCGHSDAGEGIKHAEDCRYIRLKFDWEQIKVWEALNSEPEGETYE